MFETGQAFPELFPVPFSGLDEDRKFLELCAADRRLHIGHLQVVAEVGINILMVVPRGEFAELPVEALVARIVPARRAPAVAAPVAEGLDQALKLRIAGIDRAAFAHRHVMGRIEA